MQEPGVKLKRDEDKVRVQAIILVPGLQCQPHHTSSQGDSSPPAGDDDGLLAIPRWVVCHDLGMGGDILG